MGVRFRCNHCLDLGSSRLSATGCYSHNWPLRCIDMLLALYDILFDIAKWHCSLPKDIQVYLTPNLSLTFNGRNDCVLIEKFVKRYQHESKDATPSQSPYNARSRGSFKPDGDASLLIHTVNPP